MTSLKLYDCLRPRKYKHFSTSQNPTLTVFVLFLSQTLITLIHCSRPGFLSSPHGSVGSDMVSASPVIACSVLAAWSLTHIDMLTVVKGTVVVLWCARVSQAAGCSQVSSHGVMAVVTLPTQACMHVSAAISPGSSKWHTARLLSNTELQPDNEH